MEHDNARTSLDPTALPVADVARLLAHTSGQAVTAAMIEADLAAGAPANADGTSSAAMREQVGKAREVQRRRFGADSHGLNSRMTTRQLRRHCALDPAGRDLLKQAMEDLGLSARAHDRILRMARTIADLEGSDAIQQGHVVEAINYRSLDRKLWAK